MKIIILLIIFFFNIICLNAQQEVIFTIITNDIIEDINKDDRLCNSILRIHTNITDTCSFEIIQKEESDSVPPELIRDIKFHMISAFKNNELMTIKEDCKKEAVDYSFKAEISVDRTINENEIHIAISTQINILHKNRTAEIGHIFIKEYTINKSKDSNNFLKINKYYKDQNFIEKLGSLSIPFLKTEPIELPSKEKIESDEIKETENVNGVTGDNVVLENNFAFDVEEFIFNEKSRTFQMELVDELIQAGYIMKNDDQNADLLIIIRASTEKVGERTTSMNNTAYSVKASSDIIVKNKKRDMILSKNFEKTSIHTTSYKSAAEKAYKEMAVDVANEIIQKFKKQ